MISPSGTKRALYTHEDTFWVTVHANPNGHTEAAMIEDEIIAKDYASFDAEALEKIKEQICLGLPQQS
jgi:hypothetical protein